MGTNLARSKTGKAQPATSKRSKEAARRPQGSSKFKFQDPILGAEKVESIVIPTVQDVKKLMMREGTYVVDGSLNRLQRILTRLAEGNMADVRTPFYIHQSRPQIVKALDNIVESADALQILQQPDPGFREVWWQCEEGQRSNIGIQSAYLPWTLDGPKKVLAVMSDKSPGKDLDTNAVQQALQDVSHLLPAGCIRHTTIDESLRGMGGNPKFALDPTTNGGYPTWISGWGRTLSTGETNSDRGQALQYYLSKADQQLSTIKRTHSIIDISYAGTTGQRLVQKGPNPLKPKDGKLKGKRIVIMMPKEEAILGKTVMAPLQQALAKVRNQTSGVRLIPAWASQPTLDKNMQVFLQYAEAHGRTVLSGDISSFDATLPPWFMWECAQAMAAWMEPETARIFLSIMKADVYSTSVITPTGIVAARPSSVKSGSIFTSLIGCIANYAIQRYGMYAGYYRIDQQCVMGDDFIIDGDGVVPEAISKAFADFGMECNASKQFCERGYLHFLQRLHKLGAPGGMGSVYRICGNILSLEDDTQMKAEERTAEAYVFQALARLENGNYNPLFDDLCEFIADGDSMHLMSSVDPDAIVRLAGTYAQRKMEEGKIKPWTSTGRGVPFRNWAVNRVLRGEQLPPIGIQRYEWINNIRYSAVPM